MNNQIIRSKSVDKIIVVGHPMSGYQDVETLLNSSGMQRPKPSRHDAFSPAKISATLCQSHQASAFTALGRNAAIEQIDVSALWNGMALDLFLGNIDQPLWGWSDTQSVYLLNYWKALDPRIAFVLVYDTPEQLVVRAFDEQTPLSPQALQQASRNWSIYNAALLHFYHRTPERCLLVHAQEAQASAATCLQQVSTRIGATMRVQQHGSGNDAHDAHQLASGHATAARSDALKAYLASALMQQQPDTLQLYEELQCVANLPLSEGTSATALDAWISMMEQQTRQTRQTDTARAQAKAQAGTQEVRIRDLSESLSRSLDAAKTVASERTQQVATIEKTCLIARQQVSCLEQTYITARQHMQEQQQENALLLLQLHQTQEELERCHVENRKLKTAPAVLAKPALYGAAERVRQHLSYRLGATMIEKSHSITGCLTMPSALLKQVREFRHEQKAQRNVKLPPIRIYADMHEADRIRQHLSYRLGSALLANAHSPLGWLKMPWMLRRAARDFKQSRSMP